MTKKLIRYKPPPHFHPSGRPTHTTSEWLVCQKLGRRQICMKQIGTKSVADLSLTSDIYRLWMLSQPAKVCSGPDKCAICSRIMFVKSCNRLSEWSLARGSPLLPSLPLANIGITKSIFYGYAATSLSFTVTSSRMNGFECGGKDRCRFLPHTGRLSLNYLFLGKKRTGINL